MYELIKNIGLGLFVNGSYAIMSGDVNIHTIAISIGSIFVMWMSINIEKRRKE